MHWHLEFYSATEHFTFAHILPLPRKLFHCLSLWKPTSSRAELISHFHRNNLYELNLSQHLKKPKTKNMKVPTSVSDYWVCWFLSFSTLFLSHAPSATTWVPPGLVTYSNALPSLLDHKTLKGGPVCIPHVSLTSLTVVPYPWWGVQLKREWAIIFGCILLGYSLKKVIGMWHFVSDFLIHETVMPSSIFD